MFEKSKRFATIFCLVLVSGGCTGFVNSADNGDARLSVSDSGEAKQLDLPCRTFDFRNWSLLRADDAITISGEAMMPTPAWTIKLHENTSADDADVHLVMETIEPAGISNAVIAWIPFEKTVNTNAPKQTNLSVECSGDVVWTSQDE